MKNKKIELVSGLIFTSGIILINLLIYIYPSNILDFLKLDFQNPTILSMYFNNFTHITWNHISNNLIWSLIFLLLILLWTIIFNKGNYFNWLILSSVFIVPWLISLAQIGFYHLGLFHTFRYSWGFSGIVSMLLGVLYYPLFVQLKKKGFKTYSLFMFLISLTLSIVLLSLRSFDKKFLFCIILTGSCLIYMFFKKESSKQHFLENNLWANWTIIMCTLFFFLGIFMIFPKNIINDGPVINVLGHYAGFLIGLILPQIPNIISFFINLLNNKNAPPAN